MERPPRLFLGVGNVLRRDDGVGSRAAQILAAWPLPDAVEVFDAGTLGLDAAVVLERRERVVVADAIDAAADPGTIFRLAPEQLRPGCRSGLSVHDAHLLDALDETHLLGTAPERVVILAVQIGDVSTGIGLSPAVEASLERVLRLAAHELGIEAAPAVMPAPRGDAADPRRSVPWL
ncbi:MAG: hydrogenase maturation protease [Deltaproteobacteria bacterium]|nr:MAG: hydrogenase maturation protease [Deltaproteobacteria bacterium]